MLRILILFYCYRRYPFNSHVKGRSEILGHSYFDDEAHDPNVPSSQLYKRENVRSGEYKPFQPATRVSRTLVGGFSVKKLFVEYNGDQFDFIGFR